MTINKQESNWKPSQLLGRASYEEEEVVSSVQSIKILRKKEESRTEPEFRVKGAALLLTMAALAFGFAI